MSNVNQVAIIWTVAIVAAAVAFAAFQSQNLASSNILVSSTQSIQVSSAPVTPISSSTAPEEQSQNASSSDNNSAAYQQGRFSVGGVFQQSMVKPHFSSGPSRWSISTTGTSPISNNVNYEIHNEQTNSTDLVINGGSDNIGIGTMPGHNYDFTTPIPDVYKLQVNGDILVNGIKSYGGIEAGGKIKAYGSIVGYNSLEIIGGGKYKPSVILMTDYDDGNCDYIEIDNGVLHVNHQSFPCP